MNKNNILINKSKQDSVSIEFNYNILLADDDLEMRKLLAWSLRKNGYKVVECADGNCIMKKLGF